MWKRYGGSWRARDRALQQLGMIIWEVLDALAVLAGARFSPGILHREARCRARHNRGPLPVCRRVAFAAIRARLRARCRLGGSAGPANIRASGMRVWYLRPRSSRHCPRSWSLTPGVAPVLYQVLGRVRGPYEPG